MSSEKFGVERRPGLRCHIEALSAFEILHFAQDDKCWRFGTKAVKTGLEFQRQSEGNKRVFADV
jgi:hypothetical protein